MTCNSLIFKHGLKNEQQINKQLFSITVLQSIRVYQSSITKVNFPAALSYSLIEFNTVLASNLTSFYFKERSTVVGAIKVGSFGEDANYYLHHCLLQVSSISKKLLFQITIKVFATNFANKCCKNLSCAIMVFAPNYRTNRCQITEKRFPKHQNVPFFE